MTSNDVRVCSRAIASCLLTTTTAQCLRSRVE